MRIYFKDEDGIEGEVIDCPDCGGTAIVNDGGVTCTNDNCPSNN